MQKALAILILIISCTNAISQGTNKLVTDFSGSIRTFKEVNSRYQDFSLVISGSEAYFASSREPSLINYQENNWKKSGKINVFKADIGGLDDYYEVQLSNITPMVELKDEFTHVGPLCFSESGDTLFFTKVPKKLKEKSIKVYRPQLYMIVKNDGVWDETPQVLPFNNPLEIYAHPSYDSKTQTLYFVSDRKGGAGGKDIYSSTIKNGKWTEPSNIKKVNTESDELFPHYGEDQTLFFSSNRSSGKGGLDVFYIEPKSREAHNLEFVNSDADDFGFFKVEGKNIGFLSSNRNGNDDIFALTINKQKNNKNSLFGKFKYRKLKQKIEQPLKVFLLNEKKEPVQEAFVNEDGEFEFFDMGLTEGYTVQAKSIDDMDLVIFDSEGNPNQKLLADEDDQFVYQMVDMKDVGSMNMTQTNEKGETLIAGRFLFEDNPTEETGSLKVNLINSDGAVARSVSSDEKGYFDFSELPSDQDYIVKLAEENSDLTLIIFNEDGKVVERLKDDGSGLYLFRQLKVLNINNLKKKNFLREEAFSFDSGLINGDFDKNGKDIEFSEDLLISVYDEEDNLVDTIKSNSNGKFIYKKMDGIENYSFKLDKMSESFDRSGISLKIIDDEGHLLKELQPQSDGGFVYRTLEILNIQALQARNGLDEGEFDLMGDSGQEFFGTVKYNDEDVALTEGVEVSIYDKNNVFQEKKRTNESGDFQFTSKSNMDQYNIEITDKPDDMKLSLFTVDVKEEKAGEALTLFPNGKNNFTYRKLSSLDNSAKLQGPGSLEESLSLIYSINGNFDYESKEGDFADKLIVNAFDGNGVKIGTVFTDRFGNFVFKKLPGISTVLFKINNMPENFDLDNFTLFIEDDEGKQLAKLEPSEKGFFVYKPLGFVSELPDDIKEKLDDNSEHTIFGTGALDFTNDIESVYFGSNKTNPNNGDLLKVDKMLLLMEINGNSTLEINAYADSRASDQYNLILSERRANWLKSYLTGKGISPERININAYGEGKLVNDCEDGKDCPDKFHALNRRAELRIIN